MSNPAVTASAQRYAAAAFALARDEGDLESWQRPLDEISSLMDVPAARVALTSPVVRPEEKRAVIQQLVPDMPHLVRNLVNLMIERDRADLLPQVARAFRELTNQERGIVTADVTTAVPLDQETEQTVARRLGEYLGRDPGHLVIRSRVDPSIIGGVVARVGDTLIDDSVHGRIERLRRALVG